MSPNSLTADEIVVQNHKRAFIQFGGPRPNNPVKYYGQDAQYFSITGVGANEAKIDPIYVKDPLKSSYRLVGKKTSPPDLKKATIEMYEKHGSIPKQLGVIGCSFNVYEMTGSCADLSDFTRGWTDYVLVYSYATVTNKDLGDRAGFGDDGPVTDKLETILADIYPIGPLSFGDNATTMVDLEVIDLVYGSKFQCGNCGPVDDGTNRIYAIVKSSGGSPGLPTELIYTVDGGATWNQTNITGMGVAEDPIALEISGRYLIVLSRTAGSATSGGYYISEVDSVTGIPGTWTKVIAGFVANKQPNDIYVVSAREVYFCADGGYVYKSTDVTAGVTVLNAGAATTQNLYRITGCDTNIFSAGVAGAAILSKNRGITFSALTPASGAAIRAIECLDGNRLWIGTDTGFVYSTLNGGVSWTELLLANFESGSIYDIMFVNDEVGYISHTTTTPTGRIWSTWDGGKDWTMASPRISNMVTANRFNRIDAPSGVSSTDVAVNNIAVGGLASNGVDGVLLIGAAARL